MVNQYDKNLNYNMEETIILGKIRNDYKKDGIAGETIKLQKHHWDCNWYWGFGYIGNSRLHTHFNNNFLTEETDINKIFEETDIPQDEWWVIRDLFIQAYALKECAEVYHHGGHQSTKVGVTDIIKSESMVNKVNEDLKIILDRIWSLLEDIKIRAEIPKSLELFNLKETMKGGNKK